MKTPTPNLNPTLPAFCHSSARMRPLAHAIALALSFYGTHALAQTNSVDFPPVPLIVSTSVPPNLLYIHDDSNSMYWSFMPDDIHRSQMSTPKNSKVPYQFYMSPTFNKAYYNPAFKYVPPPAPPGVTVTDTEGKVITDGTLGNSKFTDAWYNGYDIETRNQNTTYASDKDSGAINRRVNLATSYIPTDYWSLIFNRSGYNTKIKGSSLSDLSEFLFGAPQGLASYYDCPASAWKNYPTPTSTASNYSLSLCTQRYITTDAEKQNFANWYSYYRTRNYASKAGIGRAFEQLDSSVRVGWGLINKKNAVPVDGKSVNTIMQGVRSFDQNRKKTFLEWLYKIQPAAMNNSPVFISQLSSAENDGGGTPLRTALDAAGRYYDRSDGSSLGPWADNPAAPGSAATEKAAMCRKSFTILMTDGYWSGDPATTSGIYNTNVDGSAPSPFKDSYSNTLADIAWYYWKKDLLPSVASKVPPTTVPGSQTQFRDSATYQHMNTFTIGLAVESSVNKEQAFRAIYDNSVGTINWPNNPNSNNPGKIDDLMHAGVNGHGDFFSASNPDEFVAGMSAIINSVNGSQQPSSGKLASSSDDPNPVSGTVYAYKTTYKPDDWRGEVYAQETKPDTGLGATVWLASAQMPSPDSRKIVTYDGSAGLLFNWSQLNSAQQAALSSPSRLLNGPAVLEYIRGNRANEGIQIGKFRIRYRASPDRAPLGDSPNNAPVFVKYSSDSLNTVFLGANDGMLHAFNANTGEERFAYIPSALIPKLYTLTSGHEYFVDGDVMVTTPAQTSGRNVLIGALGRGGKGLYALNVSTPSYFAPNNVMWEFNAGTCPNANPSADYLGNIIGALSYAEVNGNPSVVFGNGYNSCTGKAALGFLDAVTGNPTFIKASDESGNGLSTPIILNTASASAAYAGDLKGKLWKFRLHPYSNTPVKLFDAGASQPITGQPAIDSFKDPGGTEKTFVVFGTGRYLSNSDKATTAQQSLYAIIDDGSGTAVARSDLQQRTLVETTTGGEKTLSIPPLPPGTDTSSKKGWYIDLIKPGARFVGTPKVFHSPQGAYIRFSVIIPPDGSDPCSPGGTGYSVALDPATGGNLPFAVFDLNRDRVIDEKDLVKGVPPAGVFTDGMMGDILTTNGNVIAESMNDGSLDDDPIKQLGNTSGRVSWREIVK